MGITPAQIGQAADIHQLARGAIGFSGIKHHLTGKADHLGHGLRQLANGAINPGANVDVRQHRLGIGLINFIGQLHQMHAGGGHIIDMQKLAHRRAAAPHHYFAVTA
ncbi:hypothetical protein D3C80_1721530 [compost metagenome]